MKITRYRHGSTTSYTLGAALTIELLRQRPDLVRQVLVSSRIRPELRRDIEESYCRPAGIPVQDNDKAFRILSPKGNCFVIGVFDTFSSELQPGSHLVLAQPSDAGNAGTILRTAVGFGLMDIAVIRPAVDLFDPRTVRASMGALFHIRFRYFDSFEEYRTAHPDNRLYAFMLRHSTSIRDVVFQEPFSLVFGNEATGLPDSFAEAGEAVLIPHSGAIDSLNLPIAAGIAMYEATKTSGKP